MYLDEQSPFLQQRRPFLGGGFAQMRAFVRSLSPAAWFQFNTGITSAGGFVSAWADQSGNGRNLLQATGTNQPSLEADGSILFDGVDNYLGPVSFTLNQPVTYYLLMKQVTWTNQDAVFGGGTGLNAQMLQNSATPQLALFSGSAVAVGNTGLAEDTYGVVTAQLNGASSIIQVNNGTPSTGNPGATNPGGFTLGAREAVSNFSNIQVKEAIIFPAAHDAATRARVIRYLGMVGGIAT